MILLGVLFLLNKLPATSAMFPKWFFTWPTLLIGIGLYIGVKTRFRSIAWIVLIGIGSYVLLYDNQIIDQNLKPYLFPIVLIIAGLAMLTRKQGHCRERHAQRWHARRLRKADSLSTYEEVNEDRLQVSSTFGNVEKNVFSKNFAGGSIATTFGGAQINFAQADFEGTVTIDVAIMFGGAEIIIPSNWMLRNEISVFFGGLEDRRRGPAPGTTDKVLVLKGQIMFGGIEVKSY